MKNSPIIFDIETEPDPDGERFDPARVNVGVRKDPEKIRAYIEECRVTWLEQAALSATTGKVCLIGFYSPTSDLVGGEEFELLLGQEADMLLTFWSRLSEYYRELSPVEFVGFNVVGFDMPFLIRRSWRLGLSVPAWVFDGRYIDRAFCDLLAWWRCGNRADSISLDRFARFVGLSGKERTGKDFHLFLREEPEAAKDYVRHDLVLCAQIAEKLGI
jgi:hypothetical protein